MHIVHLILFAAASVFTSEDHVKHNLMHVLTYSPRRYADTFIPIAIEATITQKQKYAVSTRFHDSASSIISSDYNSLVPVLCIILFAPLELLFKFGNCVRKIGKIVP